MGFVIIGVVLLALHFLGIGPPGQWNFTFTGDLWKFLLPFGLAVVWWSVSDSMGLTQQRAMRRMDERKAERRDKALEALGIDPRRRRKARTPGRAASTTRPPAPVSGRDPTMGPPDQPRSQDPRS
jgi:small Trp-rich protein